MKKRFIKNESIINPDLWDSLLPKSKIVINIDEDILGELEDPKLLDLPLNDKTIKKIKTSRKINNENNTSWICYYSHQ